MPQPGPRTLPYSGASAGRLDVQMATQVLQEDGLLDFRLTTDELYGLQVLSGIYFGRFTEADARRALEPEHFARWAAALGFGSVDEFFGRPKQDSFSQVRKW